MHAHGREAADGLAYARHRPEQTSLYRLVEQRYPFNIDVEICVRCGKAVRVVASIEQPALIERILAHVRGKAESDTASLGPPSTGRPVSE